MKLDPTTLTAIAISLLGMVYLYRCDDPRAWNRVKAQWSNTVGAWFARRRIVAGLNQKRRAKIRVGRPDEHSKGIMVARRDVNTGVWS